MVVVNDGYPSHVPQPWPNDPFLIVGGHLSNQKGNQFNGQDVKKMRKKSMLLILSQKKTHHHKNFQICQATIIRISIGFNATVEEKEHTARAKNITCRASGEMPHV